MKMLLIAVGVSLSLKSIAQGFDEFSDISAPSFVSPARMASSFDDSPVSITRFETEDLKYLGIDTVVDAMRLVPGIIVSDIHGSNSVAGYHASNVNVSRRMEVLFNSTSIYRPGYSNVHWHRMPVDISDLTAIEFIRGSNTVDFGSNAFSGTVNMIQAQPVLQPELTIEATKGTAGKENLWISGHVSTDNGELVGRYFHEQNTGFDKLADGTPINDDLNGDNLLLIGEHELGNGLLADVSVALNKYSFSPSSIHTVFSNDPDLEYAIPNGSSRAEEASSSIVGKISKSYTDQGKKTLWSLSAGYVNFKRDQTIDLCLSSFFFDPLIAELDASPNVHLVRSDIPLVLNSSLNTGIASLDESIIAPLDDNDMELLRKIGQRAIEIGPLELLERRCGTSDIDVSEYRKNISLLYSLEEKNMYSLVINGNVSESVVDSQHYLGGSTKRVDGNVAANFRYYFSGKAVLNMGGNLESSNKTSRIYPSYRAAFNFLPYDNQIFRVLYSHSERSPDIHELERKWNYEIKYFEGVTDHLGKLSGRLPRIAISPKDLVSEKIDSFEAGYIFNNNTHTFDIKYFYEHLYDLISEPFFYLDFRLSNNGENDMNGFEFAYRYESHEIKNLKLGVSFTHLYSKPTNEYENTLFSENYGSVYLIFPFNTSLTLGSHISYYDNLAENNDFRFNTTLTYEKSLGSFDIKLALNYKRLPESISSYTELSTDTPIISYYENNNQWSVNLSIEY